MSMGNNMEKYVLRPSPIDSHVKEVLPVLNNSLPVLNNSLPVLNNGENFQNFLKIQKYQFPIETHYIELLNPIGLHR